MLKIIDVGTKFGNGVSEIFTPWGATIVHPNKLGDVQAHLHDAAFVCFGGGQDVHPSMYGHRNVASQCGDTKSLRDLWEYEVFKMCMKMDKPMFGVCRGSQFLCAMAGGALIQDIGYGHGSDGHILETKDGRKIPMTTTHHQMMWPFILPADQYELLAWIPVLQDTTINHSDEEIDRIINKIVGKKRQRNYSYDALHLKIVIPDKEPEIVWFPKIKALACQGHPEYYPDLNCESVQYVRDLVEQHLLRR